MHNLICPPQSLTSSGGLVVCGTGSRGEKASTEGVRYLLERFRDLVNFQSMPGCLSSDGSYVRDPLDVLSLNPNKRSKHVVTLKVNPFLAKGENSGCTW